MTQRRLVGWIFALVAILLVGTTAAREPAGFWAPHGFLEVADDFISSGKLRFVPGPNADSIVPVLEGDEEAERFYDLSYLRSDVRRFNADPLAPRTPFVVRNNVLTAVDSTFHRIDLPYRTIPRWHGDVRLSGRGDVAVLTGLNGASLEIRHPTSRFDTEPDEVLLPAGGVRISSSNLALLEPRTREVLARIFFVGDRLVLEDVRDRGSPAEIRLSGVPTTRGQRLETRGGDWLHIRSPLVAATFLVGGAREARTLSFARVLGERVSRHHTDERLRHVTEPLSQALDLAIGAEDRVAGLQRHDLRLTLDRELSRALEPTVLGFDRCRATDLERPRNVSLVVIDAGSGAVEALPSCPDEDLVAERGPLSRRDRERLLRNQNLVSHPIGSAGKPFWAAAVGTAHPNLVDLRVPGHGEGVHETLLGCGLTPGYFDFAHQGTVGLERFISSSCNRYLLEMTTAALAIVDDPALPPGYCNGERTVAEFRACLRTATPAELAAARPGEGPGDEDRAGADPTSPDSAGGAEIATLALCDADMRIVLADELPAVEGCRLNGVREAFDPTLPLEDITGARTLSELAPGPPAGRDTTPRGARFRSGRYRFDIWRGVLEAFERAGSRDVTRTALRFASVTPEATNLELNTVENLRRDWVNLLLGGENSRWSNVELAEATARLMTGRAVRASLVDRFAAGDDDDPGAGGSGAAGTAADFPILPESGLHPGVRRRVLHAMELVWQTGTAAEYLREPIQALVSDVGALGFDLYVFAKTGTARVDKLLPSGDARALVRLYESGELGQAGDSVWIEPGGPVARGLSAGYRARLDRRYLRPMRDNPGRYRVRRGEAPSHPVFFTPQGTIAAALLPDDRIEREAGLVLLGFLAVPRDAGRAEARGDADWITACPDMSAQMRRSILEIPRADRIDPERSVALSVAAFVDDLDPEGSIGSREALRLTQQSFPAIAAHILAEVEARTDRD